MEYLLLVTLIHFQPLHQSQSIRVLGDRIVCSENDLPGARRKIDGFTDLLGEPLRILLRIRATRSQSRDVRVDIRMLVNELGHILKPWIAKVTEDHSQLLPLVSQSIQRQRMRADEVPGAERGVPGVEEHRKLLGLGIIVKPVKDRAFRRNLHVTQPHLEGLHHPPVFLGEFESSLHLFGGGLYRYHWRKHSPAPPAQPDDFFVWKRCASLEGWAEEQPAHDLVPSHSAQQLV